jgi:HEAT repeat protein
VLGLIRDRRATDVLIRAMQSEDGWVHTYAATALGDLGDPAAVVALVRQMTILGDPLRPLDQWEYPGAGNINVAESDWNNASYYVIDTSAADACLRLGVRGAVGWLIENQLDPRKKNFRIRVLQDATDALRRSVPGIPVAQWNVDSGLPRREKAFHALVAWWWEHRDDEKVLRSELSPTDARLLPATLGLADVLSGAAGVREMMMAKAAIRVLGPLMTPALADRSTDAQSPLHRAEIAQSLGLVRDPHAVPVLMQLVRDKAAFVRANATQSLGPYADGSDEIRDLLLLSLRSKRADLRLAAMNALVHLRAQPEVAQALATWLQADGRRVEAGQPSWRTPAFDRALTVVQLVQEGAAHWPAVRAGLHDEQRVLRRTWWDLVRAALQLPDHLHDPVTTPGDPYARQLDDAEALAALQTRRP